MNLVTLLTVLVLLLAIALVWTLAQLHRRVHAIQARLTGQPPLPATGGNGRPRISIEILNPFELANRETPLAGPAAKVAPKMIERIVYARAAGIIITQLEEQGVKAKVETHVP